MDATGLLLSLFLAQSTPSLAVSREYHFVNLIKTWMEAQSYCRERYADLATIDSAEQWARVEQMIANSGHAHVWIGLYEDINSWKWSMDNTYLYKGGNTELGSWFVFHRNNYRSKESCAEFLNGYLNDLSCTASRKSVCYDEPSNTFIPVTILMTWSAAQSYCRETYTDLASMRSEQEKEKLMSVTSDQSWWIGLSRDTWKWSDQSNTTFMKWDGVDPNGGASNCVNAHVGGWYDAPCSHTSPFICSVATKRRVKLVLKTDGSVDLNDPQILEAMLKHMEKNMTDQGIHRGFRLRWKDKSSGKIFNKIETVPLF